jgi:cellulase/cellobiase CelA1
VSSAGTGAGLVPYRRGSRARVPYTKRELSLAAIAAVMAVAAATFLGLYVASANDRSRDSGDRVAGPAKPTSSAPPTAPASGGPRTLTAGYALGRSWKGGFNADLVVTNLSSQPVQGWIVQLQMPAGVSITQTWSADATQVATSVTLRSQPWNSYLAPGGAVHFGFQAKGDAAAPKACTINGWPCS